MKNQRLTFFIFISFFFLLYAQAFAAGGQWDKTLTFLEERFPAVYEQLGTVSEMNGDRIVFVLPAGKKAPARGSELLVTTRDEHPIYLQEPSTLIKVVSVFGEKVLTDRVMTVGRELKKGDNVVVPASPTIYLYTNIRGKDGYAPYRTLLESLLERNLEVVELTEPEITDKPERYGLLLRLEQSESLLVCKLQSIYSKDTLLSLSSEASAATELVRPAGREVALARPVREITQGQQIPYTSPGRAYPAALFGEQEGAPFMARTLTPAEEEFYNLSGEGFTRLVITDLNGDGESEACLLNEFGIYLFQFANGRLEPLDQFAFDEEVIPLHLHSIDLDGDGADELLVTLSREILHAGNADNQLASMVLSWKRGALVTMARNLPYYLRAIEDRAGKKVALGQTQQPYDQYDGPIFKIVYNHSSGTVTRGDLYQPAAEIYSLYQFNLDPADKDHILIIEPSNEVYGYYAPEEKVYAISPRKYGDYQEVGYPKKMQTEEFNRGGFEKQGSRMLFSARRFALINRFDHQTFIINKERQSSLSLVGETMNRVLGKTTGGEDSLVGLSWRGKQIAETWQSADIAKDIIDFSFIGDKGYVLVRDARGEYAIEAVR
ncbi:MAG TPA: VCBS repeat-containing protein [Desulfarculaceae bacterium]|nr:VCBS repeat-containing protein [Desulfarculaceae bacterium]